ncbi:MAG: response regulator [Anaerolineales bacterium]|nr:response regulator [Anaerolineales bacterium]MCB9146902.1 response regulator [Anaerolineales bacterium]
MTLKPLAFVVEDDPILNDINCLTLEPYFQVESYLRGDLAFEALDFHVPDLIVLDINLPGMSGEKILKKLRGSERFLSIKIILTTADNIQAATLDSLADIVLLKPISPNQLKEMAVRVSKSMEKK